MHENQLIDGLELEIITALQVSPRVSWTALGRILNVDSSTLSRRWNRLKEERLVWTSCDYLPELTDAFQARFVAFVEITCIPGDRDAVVKELVSKANILGVQCTTGRRDLSATVRAQSLQDIDDFVQREIAVIPGIVSTTVHIASRLHQDGASWRLPLLNSRQVAALRNQRAGIEFSANPSPYHLALIDELRQDARTPIATLRERVGGSLATASRSVDMLLRAPWVSWRVDFAYLDAGWSCSAIIWMSLEQDRLEDVAKILTAYPQVRMCASVSGEHNLMATLRLRGLQELDEVEARLAALNPPVHVRDRWIVPKIPKLQGHILDDAGRHVSYVPIG
ncbi:Lrp/AsnC ligand binding domain-containing protein [Paenarthrobacter sp.]|uniref:Lrp/AsnC family transcriptional regulator n=1 Tax=Paenarthrobacter sp. TaxID=1931993 RepID=UPI00281283A0|nr:Lrp/AsnC ligand binding domain-containing protein [Paenarthrobacter sp.]